MHVFTKDEKTGEIDYGIFKDAETFKSKLDYLDGFQIDYKIY